MSDKKLPIVDYCLVCGLPWVMTREKLNDEICPSCGSHIGWNDFDLENAREHREQWLATGPVWWSRFSSEPPNWNPQEQMKNIPPDWL
jgi:hypothetical protein